MTGGAPADRPVRSACPGGTRQKCESPLSGPADREEDAEVTCERSCVELLNLADGLLEHYNLAFVPAASGVR